MNEIEIKEYFFEDFKKEIQKVIENSEKLKVTSKIILSPHEVIEYLKSIGFKNDNLESNGWDWDFWNSLNYKNETYYLSCSGYYNKGLTFSKK